MANYWLALLLLVAACERPTPAAHQRSGSSPPQVATTAMFEDDEMSFQMTEVGEFPPLVTEEFFGRQQPDRKVFARAFMTRMEELHGKKIEQIQLFNGGSARNSLAFVYFEDLTTRGVELAPTGNLASWLAGMAESFGGAASHRVSHRGVNGSAFGDWEKLTESPAKAAKHYAPTSHRRVELADEKASYLAYATAASAPPFERSRFEAAWTALRTARSMEATPPASPDALVELEEAVGTALPEDLKALYAATGGVEKLLFGFDLLSLEQVIAEHASWSAIYDDWTLDDLKSTQSAEPGIFPVFTTPRRVPFVDLVGGNHLAVDLGPAAGGVYGQVIVAGSDVDNKRRIARSVTELLEIAATYDGSEEHPLFSVFGRLRQ